MAAGVIFVQWDSYVGGREGPALFAQEPLSFNTRQERLHRLGPGDRLWLVSRCPDDGQYYFIAALVVSGLARNPPGGEKAERFGEYAVVADRSRSEDFRRSVPAEGLLRAFVFETGRPIKYGASLGQSLQTLRLLSAGDEAVLNAVAEGVRAWGLPACPETCGLWTKCDAVFSNYFLTNWTQRREPLAFLLYDPPPSVRPG